MELIPRSPRPARVRALALALALAAPPAAFAQAPSSAEGDAFEPDPATSSIPLGGRDEAVVVGRRRRTEATGDRTASATVVSADRYAGEAKGVAELVATAPGVAVSDYGGLGRFATASIRGSTADGVLVLLDGIPLTTAFGGGVDLSSIPRAWVERIEVIRGVEGAHYGAGALGGVVNVVTRRAAADTWSAEASGGSFRTYAVSGDRGVRLGRATLLVAGSADGTSGEFPYLHDRFENQTTDALEPHTRADNGTLRAGTLAKLALPVGPFSVDAVAQASGGRRDLPPAPGHDADGSRDWQRDGRILIAARAAGPGPIASSSTILRSSLRLDTLDTRLAALGGGVSRQSGGVFSGGLEALLDHPGGLLRLDGSAEAEWIEAAGAGGSRVRPRLSLAVGDELRAASGRVRVAPAARLERVGEYTGASGKLGAAVVVRGPLSVRASAGRTYRPPSFGELYLQQGIVQPNRDLRPEHGTGADASLVLDAPAGMASVGGQATMYRDLIIYDVGMGGRLKPFNTGKAFLAGLEAEAATAPLRSAADLVVAASYTYLRSENQRGADDVVGNDLPRRPRHRLYARASVAPGRFGAHVELQYVGAQWADARNRDRIPAALLWGAGGSVALRGEPALSLHVEVRNALDDRTLLDPIQNPLPGRMVLLSIRAGAAPRKDMP